MKPCFCCFILSASASFLLVACGRPAAHDEAHEHAGHAEPGESAEESAGVNFDAGRGLRLSPEIVNALGLTVVEVVERPISPVLELTAHVFATQPDVLASVRVPLDRAEALANAEFSGAKLLRIDRSTASATRLVDVIFRMDRSPAPHIGEFVSLSRVESLLAVLAVPRSAILDAATGTFVYLANGDAYLRTPVKLGVRSVEFVEISDGLKAGDRVVVSPVEQLWLAELRLTKGGGHGH